MTGLSINTNVLSLNSQRKTNTNQAELTKAMEKLSSGLRINSAKDDAAGMTVSSNMTSTIRVGDTLARNINDGISLTQVAGGALTEIEGILQRSRELAVQAGNGTLGASDRKVLNREFLQLLQEVDRLADSTEIFGLHPLKGEIPKAPEPVIEKPPAPPPPPPATGDTPIISDELENNGDWKPFSSGIRPIAYIPSGATQIQIDIDSLSWDDDIQIFTQDGKHIAGTQLGDPVWMAGSNGVGTPADVESNVFLESSGFSNNASYDDSELLDGSTAFGMNDPLPLQRVYNEMSISYSGDGFDSGSYYERIFIDKTTEPLLIMVVGSGSFYAKASWGSMPAEGEPVPIDPLPTEPLKPEIKKVEAEPDPINIVVEAQYGKATNVIGIKKTPSSTKDLGIGNTVIDPFEAAKRAMEELNEAIKTMGDYKSYYGSVEQRLDTALSNLYDNRENLSAARSRIMDADYAQATAELSRAQVLTNAGLAMQVQANTTPQLVLPLLQQANQ